MDWISGLDWWTGLVDWTGAWTDIFVLLCSIMRPSSLSCIGLDMMQFSLYKPRHTILCMFKHEVNSCSAATVVRLCFNLLCA